MSNIFSSSERAPVNRQAYTGAITVRALELLYQVFQSQLAVVLRKVWITDSMATGRAWIKHHVKLFASSERAPVDRQAYTGAITVRALEFLYQVLQSQLAVMLRQVRITNKMATGRAWIKHHVELFASSERGPVNRQASTGAIIVRVLEFFD